MNHVFIMQYHFCCTIILCVNYIIYCILLCWLLFIKCWNKAMFYFVTNFLFLHFRDACNYNIYANIFYGMPKHISTPSRTNLYHHIHRWVCHPLLVPTDILYNICYYCMFTSQIIIYILPHSNEIKIVYVIIIYTWQMLIITGSSLDMCCTPPALCMCLSYNLSA